MNKKFFFSFNSQIVSRLITRPMNGQNDGPTYFMENLDLHFHFIPLYWAPFFRD